MTHDDRARRLAPASNVTIANASSTSHPNSPATPSPAPSSLALFPAVAAGEPARPDQPREREPERRRRADDGRDDAEHNPAADPHPPIIPAVVGWGE